MLILTRLTNESVMIGDDIEVVVTEVRGDKVRLGFRCARSIPVHRKELYAAITAAQKEQRP